MAYLLKPASQPGVGTELVQRINWTPGGLGCACGGQCKGMGIFDSGMDLTQWGLIEWATVGTGLLMLISTVNTIGQGVRSARAIPGERRKRKAASLRKRADELTKKR